MKNTDKIKFLLITILLFNRIFLFSQDNIDSISKMPKLIPIKIENYESGELGALKKLTQQIAMKDIGYYDRINGKVVVKSEYMRGRPSYEGLAAVAIPGKGKSLLDRESLWGFIDENGRVVVPCKYEDVSDFSEGIAFVKLNGKWGIINNKGEEVVECKYEEIIKLSEGLIPVKLNNKWGYIDKTGKQVLPFVYDYADVFNEGWAYVEINKEFYGFIDKDGHKVFPIPKKYEKYYTIFSEDFLGVMSNNKWGYIDKTGKEVIPCNYEEVSRFSEGLAFVKLNNKWGVVNRQGKVVIEFKYDKSSRFQEGLAPVVVNEKLGYINKNGKEIIPHKYDYDVLYAVVLGEKIFFRNGLAYVDRKYNYDIVIGTKTATMDIRDIFYVDIFGNEYRMLRREELEKKYTSYGFLDYDIGLQQIGKYPLAMVGLNKKYGIINLVTSKEIVPLKYDWIGKGFSLERSISEGLIIVKSGSKYGYIDINGKEVIPCKYEDVKEFSYGLAAVKLNNKWGYIDTTGKEVIPFIYDEASNFYYSYLGNYAEVKLNGVSGKIDKEGNPFVVIHKENNKYGLKDSFGKIILECKYDYISNFDGDFANIELEGLKGKVDKKGNIVWEDGAVFIYQQDNKYGLKYSFGKIIVEPKYDEIKMFKGGYAAVKLNNLWGFVDKYGQEVIKPRFTEISETEDERYGGKVYTVNILGRWIPINFIIERKKASQDSTDTQEGSTTPSRPPLRRR